MRRDAFTLLEALIAIALSMVVCATAATALRLCAATFSATQRLGQVNRLMREGVLAALDDLDTWRSCDDPDDPARQTLRAPGMAFAPMDFAAPAFTPEAPQDDPKTWWRGLAAVGDDRTFGNYALHSRIGHPDAERRWYPDMLARIASGLGHYALIDYLPANAVYSLRDESEGVPERFLDPWTDNTGLYGSPGFRSYARQAPPRDLLGISASNAWAVTTEPWYVANDAAHRYFSLWSYVPQPAEWAFDRLHEVCPVDLGLLPLRPAAWPSLRVSIDRFVVTMRWINDGRVVLGDPVSGAVTKLNVISVCTTLRGARGQRRAGGGWAKAGDATLDGAP